MADTMQVDPKLGVRKGLVLEVVTPDRLVFNEPVEFFSLKGLGGDLGILPGHIPLFTGVKPCILRYKREGGQVGIITLMGGFLDVQPGKATVLADAAERGEDIDAARAKAAKDRAENKLSSEHEAGAQIALERAMLRIEAVNSLGSLVRR